MSSPKSHAPSQHAGETWTTRRLLKWMAEHFRAKSIDSPRLVAEMLLSHVLGCERMKLYMEADRPASPTELTSLRDLVSRAAKHEPVQYLVGHGWFFGRQFDVNRSTLIPRPCTETLVEHIIQWHRLNPGHAAPLIADIGTGTGCIAVSLGAQIADAKVIATDLISEAIELAKANAERHGVIDRIEFRVGPGLSPLRESSPTPGERFDVIASNPPYISDREWNEVPPNVKQYEPVSALRGGADGLNVMRPLISGAGEILNPGGLLAVEIADSQRDAAIDLAKAAATFENIDVLKDHEGLWRVLVANRS